MQKGGTLIPFKRAIRWAKSKGISKVTFKKSSDDDSKNKKRRPYEKQGADAGAEVIGGAIFSTELDLTHPLGFGYHSSIYPFSEEEHFSLSLQKTHMLLPWFTLRLPY